MTRPRPLESSAFVLVLGTLLAHRGSIEAVAHFQPHHVQEQQTRGWVHRRGGVADAGTRGIRTELVPCQRDSTEVMKTTDVARQSLGMRIAAALRGGQSRRQGRTTDIDGDVDSDEEEAEEGLEGEEEEEQEGEEEEEVVLYDEKAVQWMMQQLCMYQTRTALISNPLAAKVLTLCSLLSSTFVRLSPLSRVSGF